MTEAQIATLTMRVSVLEHENAELSERLAQMASFQDAMNLRITELLLLERQEQKTEAVENKEGAWEMVLPGINGGPSRSVSIKRTA